MMKHREVTACLVVSAALALGACGPAQQETGVGPGSERTSNPGHVIGKRWRWVDTVTPVETIEAADPDRYTIRLTSEGRAEIRFDCNRGGGEYRIDTGKLEFGLMASTRMACPPDSQDAVFMRQLEAVRIFFVENGELYLDLFADGGTMRFQAADAD